MEMDSNEGKNTEMLAESSCDDSRNSTQTKLLKEYEEWAKLNSSLLTLSSDGVCDDGRIYLKFTMGRNKTFTLFCPALYPNHEDNVFFVEATPSLQLWCNTINEFILDSDSLLSLETILYKAAALYYKNVPKSPCNSSSDSEVEGEEDMMLGEESDEEWEYTISQKKKQWRLKEALVRAVTNQPKISDMFEGSVKDHPKQVFSNSGASGILTNDLVALMKSAKQTGIKVEAVEDNIYRWYVFLSSFNRDGKLQEDLHQLLQKYGYNYIQLQLDFTMDLYPFYPPIIKVVRPRLQGSMMLRVASLVKLSTWNPARDMKSVLVEIKEYLGTWARLDVKSERNDLKRFPHGSYLDIENHLLWLASVSEIAPRACLRYPDIARDFTFSPVNNEKSKKPSKNIFPAGTGFSSDIHTGWDVNAFLAAQREKDKQVECVLQNILQELKTGCSAMTNGKTGWCNKAWGIDGTYSSFSVPSCSSAKASDSTSNDSCRVSTTSNHVTNNEKKSEEKMVVNDEGDCTSAQNGINSTDLEDLFSVLEASTLVPFLVKKLQVDSFLEICQHTSVYQRVVDIIKEIARYPELVPLLWNLPEQKHSIYSLVHRLEDQAKVVLAKVGKTSANGNIPKGSKGASCSSVSSSTPAVSDQQQSDDEKLARDFYEMSQAVDVALQDLGLLASQPELGALLPGTSQVYTKSLAQSYKEALKDMQFLSCDIEVEGASAHHFSSDFKMALPPNSAQVMRIAQEMAALSTALPLDLESAIFIRTDDAKCTLLRALIIGPEGTPYSGGCFQFDIFFPSRYPSSPPLVHFCTTGLGQVRFNPNLYASGTVCLSLLGTWKGLQGEHWNQTSTLLQVLVSIQSLILVPEPFFNEPGYESLLGTAEGNVTSKAYNMEILQHTINHAMVSQLRRPSPGFEDVINTHFRIKKDRILQEIRGRMDGENSPALENAFDVLQAEFEKLSSAPSSSQKADDEMP
ncbi:hypothetical protein R5R35_011533 [Gryllus longicercus]|uniref:UBC core domain-containing protein n=1 Tax=Gryllus longicercus TaxID=2509291 RepID=A0AAN9Z6R1_9ORTH